MKLKLPKFKVTHIGEKTTTHLTIPRGRTGAFGLNPASPLPPTDSQNDTDDDEIDTTDFDFEPNVSIDDLAEPSTSLHAIKEKASWDHIRSTLHRVAIESSALPSGEGYILCTDPATHRCTQCGAWAYYCTKCFAQAHSVTNFFHVGEVWEVSSYVRIKYHICVI